MALNTNQQTDKITPSTGTLDIVGTLTVNGVVPGGGGGPTHLVQSADVTATDSGFTTLTGLSFTAAASGIYKISVVGSYTTANSTRQPSLALTIPSGTVSGFTVYPSNFNATTASTVTIAQNTSNAIPTLPGSSAGVSTTLLNPIAGEWTVVVGGTGGTISLGGRTSNAFDNLIFKANHTILSYQKVN